MPALLADILHTTAGGALLTEMRRKGGQITDGQACSDPTTNALPSDNLRNTEHHNMYVSIAPKLC
jgi:hypothetical protein